MYSFFPCPHVATPRLQGLCTYQASGRWDYLQVLRSPLLQAQELQSWADAARRGAEQRQACGAVRDAASLNDLAQLYQDLKVGECV
jgi:hypothetical protein